MTEEEVYQKCFDKWGLDSQLDQMVEECAEYIVALSHHRRERIPAAGLIAEMVDVYLMASAMAFHFGNSEEWKRAKAEKIERVEALLNGAQK